MTIFLLTVPQCVMAVHTSVDLLNRKAVSPTVHCSGFNETGRRTSLEQESSIQDKSGIGIEVFWKLTRRSSDEASLGNRPEADREWVGVKVGLPCLSRSLINFSELLWSGVGWRIHTLICSTQTPTNPIYKNVWLLLPLHWDAYCPGRL